MSPTENCWNNPPGSILPRLEETRMPTTSKPSVLIVDSDRERTEFLTTALKEEGHSVRIARDGAHALSILQFRAFEVLVIDMAHSVVNGTDVIAWASGVTPKPRIVALANRGIPVPESSALARGAGLFLHIPPNMNKLWEFLAPTRSRSSFMGQVDDVDIVEYMQFVLLGGRTTIVEVTSTLGTHGWIYVSNGNVVHAECGVLQGEQALYRCLCFKEGTFRHRLWEEPEKVTIRKPGEFILMEAVRKRDEVWGGGNGHAAGED
jgi:CheY-like chemotaxis protein